MKKILFLIILMTFMLIVSCDSIDEDTYGYEQPIGYEQPMQDAELLKLYVSIDSLHYEYSDKVLSRESDLDKWSMRFLCGAVDACVAAISAETGPVGAFLLSTTASGLYEDYLNDIKEDMEQETGGTAQNPPSSLHTIIYPNENPTFIDSIGHYHNIVLNKMQLKNASFITDNGNINYAAYCKEVIAESNIFRINGGLNSVPPAMYFKYIDSIIKPLSLMTEGNQEILLSIIFNKTFYSLKISSSRLVNLPNICSKIIYNDVSVCSDQVVEYGAKVNDLIEKSGVVRYVKDDLKIANNIAINSSLYWSAKFHEM